jgi:hypothetical protein
MIYGYSQKQINESGLLEMKEVSFQVGPDALEEIARFLNEMAGQIRSGRLRAGGHRHAEEFLPGWRKRHSFDLIVCAEPAKSGTDRAS